MRQLLCAVCVLTAFAENALAAEYRGVLRKVDTGGMIVIVEVGGKDTNYRFTKDSEFADEANRLMPAGPFDRRLRPGEKVTVMTKGVGFSEVISRLRLGH